jgi:HAMP domain-containing protein
MKINKKFDDHRKIAYGNDSEIDIALRLRRATGELEERYHHSNEGMFTQTISNPQIIFLRRSALL